MREGCSTIVAGHIRQSAHLATSREQQSIIGFVDAVSPRSQQIICQRPYTAWLLAASNAVHGFVKSPTNPRCLPRSVILN
eukprot:6175849-Pleurochrysis_carterae.AAC.3